MDSIWKTGTELPEFPELNENKKVDVLIIGGGMTGILCAHFLRERGVDYLLAEAERICSGSPSAEKSGRPFTIRPSSVLEKVSGCSIISFSI